MGVQLRRIAEIRGGGELGLYNGTTTDRNQSKSPGVNG